MPKPARQGYITFMLPAREGSAWLTVWRDMKAGQVGVFLSTTRSSVGERAALSVLQGGQELETALGGLPAYEIIGAS